MRNICFPGQFLLAYKQFFEGRFAVAADIMKPLMGSPDSAICQFWTAYFLAYANRITEAQKIIEAIEGTTALDRFFRLLKLALQGKRQELVESISPAMVDMARRDPMKTGWLVSFYAMLEDKEHTLEWIETAINHVLINFPFFNRYDPFLAKLHGEPRFKKLMERVKYEWEHFEI